MPTRTRRNILVRVRCAMQHVCKHGIVYCALILQLSLCSRRRPPRVMPTLGIGLMRATPPRPAEDVRCRRNDHPDQPPEQTANLRHTQADDRPRCALNACRLVGPVSGAFFSTGTSATCARTTAKKACATHASVMWRYHPDQLRTS